MPSPAAAVAAASPAACRPPFFNISSRALQSPAASMGPVSQPNGSRGYYGRPAFASASPASSPTAVGNISRGRAFSSIYSRFPPLRRCRNNGVYHLSRFIIRREQ